MTQPLRLVALDEDDLAILSANLQDALIAVADMTYLPQTKRFVLVGKRFDWVKAGSGACERCATGLHFERCSASLARGSPRAKPIECSTCSRSISTQAKCPRVRSA